MHQTNLLFTPGCAVVWLRELCAHDELSVTDVGTYGAVDLLNRLLISPDGSAVVPAASVATADRDRLLAMLYRGLFGTRIESTLTCTTCAEPFDVNFRLDDLLTFMQPAMDKHPAEPITDGMFQLPDGTRFRLPTGADELSIAGMPTEQAVQQLLQRCTVQVVSETTNETIDSEVVQQAMEVVAPLLDMDLGAQCPECGQAQSVHFSMQSFLLNRIKNEQRQVAADVHQLAVAYRWAHTEISALPRRLRRMYVGLIQSDRIPADQWLS